MEDKMTHAEYTRKLQVGIFEVSFKKVNGEKRTMTCTLSEHILPKATKEDPLSQKKVRAINEEVVSTWDVNANGWRAFRVENVTEFKRIGGACWCGRTSSEIKKCDGTHNTPV